MKFSVLMEVESNLVTSMDIANLQVPAVIGCSISLIAYLCKASLDVFMSTGSPAETRDKHVQTDKPLLWGELPVSSTSISSPPSSECLLKNF